MREMLHNHKMDPGTPHRKFGKVNPNPQAQKRLNKQGCKLDFFGFLFQIVSYLT